MIEVDLLRRATIIKVSDNGRGIPVGIQQQDRPSGRRPSSSPSCTRAASSAAAATRCRAACTASAPRSSTPCPSGSRSRCCDGEHRYYQRFERGKECAPLAITGDTDQKGTQVAFQADPEIFEEVSLRLRHPAAPAARAGVPQRGGLHRPDATSGGPRRWQEHLHYEGGIRSFVEHIHQQKGVESLHDEVDLPRGAGGGQHRRGGAAVQRQLHRAAALLCEQHPHDGRRRARGRVQGGAHPRDQRLRPPLQHP